MTRRFAKIERLKWETGELSLMWYHVLCRIVMILPIASIKSVHYECQERLSQSTNANVLIAAIMFLTTTIMKVKNL